MLSDRFSSNLIQNKSFVGLTILNLFLKGCKRVEEGLYLPFLPQLFKKKNNVHTNIPKTISVIIFSKQKCSE